jgi:hypothetical protein
MLLELKTQFCFDNFEQIHNEKFQCKICDKVFCGQEFVIQHTKNKH